MRTHTGRELRSTSIRWKGSCGCPTSSSSSSSQRSAAAQGTVTYPATSGSGSTPAAIDTSCVGNAYRGSRLVSCTSTERSLSTTSEPFANARTRRGHGST